MIHLINLILKLLVSIFIFPMIGTCLIILGLIFWDMRYFDVAETIINDLIWGKNK